MNISVIYFSVLKKITGKSQEVIRLEKQMSAEDLFGLLSKKYPEMVRYKPYIRLSVNQEYLPFETRLKPDDEVVFITPVSGG
ncbi:MAG: MoaD/ThiS family protein [Balneolales bacterium]